MLERDLICMLDLSMGGQPGVPAQPSSNAPTSASPNPTPNTPPSAPDPNAYAQAVKKGKVQDSLILACGLLVIVITVVVLGFLLYRGLDTFTKYNHSFGEFFFSTKWKPVDGTAGGGLIGSASYIVGTLVTSFLALLIAGPLAVAIAIYVSEMATPRMANLVRSGVELFSGIPSVIFGWIGLTALVPFIKKFFQLSNGFSLLSASLVLSLMILPIIATVACDAMLFVPDTNKKAAYALGSSKWQVISKVCLPTAKTRIISGMVLGLARAFGEALAVAMVIGKSRNLPRSILDSANTLTAAISSDMGSAMEGGEYNAVLWTMALLLFLMSAACILLIRYISHRDPTRIKSDHV